MGPVWNACVATDRHKAAKCGHFLVSQCVRAFCPDGVIVQIAQLGSCLVRLSLSPEAKGEKSADLSAGFLFWRGVLGREVPLDVWCLNLSHLKKCFQFLGIRGKLSP